MRIRSSRRRCTAVSPFIMAVRSGFSSGQADGNDAVKGDGIRISGRFIATLLWVVLLALGLVGCRKYPSFEPGGVGYLRWLIEQGWVPADAKERGRIALSQYDAATLSPEPTLILAALSSPAASDEVRLVLVVCDANEDLRGVTFSEETVDSDGVRSVLTEDYPFYAHWIGPGVINDHGVTTNVRNHRQRKDEKIWADYLAMDFEAAMQEALNAGDLQVEPEDPEEMAPLSDPLWEARMRFWRQTLPTIWVSDPDASGTTVWVQVYDHEGHRSNSVELLGLSHK